MTPDLPSRTHGVDGQDAARERASGLLRELLAEVASKASPAPPDAARAPASLTAARTRRAGRGPVAVAVAVGVLSFGGVAAASTQVAVGNPLHGLGSVVRAAAGSMTGSGSSEPPPGVAARTTAGTTAEPAARGRDVDGLLRTADELYAAGRVDEAWASLAEAERSLAETSELGDGPARRDRAVEIRARLQAGRAGAAPGDTAKDPDKDTAKDTDKDPSGDPSADDDSAGGGSGDAVPPFERAPSTSAPAPVEPAPAPEDPAAGSAAPKAPAKKQAPSQQDRVTAPAGRNSGEGAGKGGSH